MKNRIFAIGITAIFFGLALISADVSATSPEPQNNSGISYVLAGRISSYEVVEYNGTQYLDCIAIRVRAFFWGVFNNFPNLVLRQTLRWGNEFMIPFESANISGPNALGNYFLVARGVF